MYCEIKGIMLTDSRGGVIYSKYYNPPTSFSTSAFEQELKVKTTRRDPVNDIMRVGPFTSVYRGISDFALYVLADPEENEFLLDFLLDLLVETLDILFEHRLEKRVLVEKIDYFMLVIDETFHEGVILHTDPAIIIENTLIRHSKSHSVLRSLAQSFKK